MAADGHIRCPKITFGRISGHFRSIRNFFFWNFYFFVMSENHYRSHFYPFHIDTLLLTSAILDVRNSLSIAFLAISDRSAILNFRNSLSIAILAISDRYRIFFFRRPFWISENHVGSHFWPFQIDRPFWMSEIQFRWHFILAISDPYGTFFFDKMAAGGYFGCPKITFDRISVHFRLIHNFF